MSFAIRCSTALRAIPALIATCAAWSHTPAADVSPDHAKRIVAGTEIFKKDVRAILIDRCVSCHGRDAIEGGFDLSTREDLLKGGDSGKAVVPGQAKKSLLYKLITHQQQPRMPYEEDKLSDEQTARIAAWIDHEAPYDEPLVAGKEKPEAKPWTEKVVSASARDHWAFRPLKRPEAPRVAGNDWCVHDVDRFLLASMETQGLSPNPTVDRRTLIRRASFDLLGLPPSPEEVEAFVNDPAPDAYERLLDRLLASPHYGERWARHWLDLARFAESHGFEHDYDRPTAYHYRDFVIRALNDDLPYDTFVKWQLAGDELAPKDNLALMATGFLAAGVHSTQITANEVEKHRYDEMDDMLATTGTAMLGLTIGCARCHDHKFDAIPQADYYRLLSTFTTTVRSEVELDFDPEGYRKAKSAFDAKHAPFVAAVEAFEKDRLPARLAAWETTRTPADASKWILLDLVEFKSAGGAKLEKQSDGSLLASGTNPNSDTFTIVAHTDQVGVTGIRLEALSHPSLVKGGPGRAANGNFALTDFRVKAAAKGGKGTPIDVVLQNPQATFEQKGLEVKGAIDGDAKTAWAVDPQFGKDHAASFESEQSFGFPGGTILTFTLKFENNTGHGIGRPRLSITTGPKPVSPEGAATPANIVTVLGTPAEKRSAEQTVELLRWYRHQDEEWRTLNQAADEHLQMAPKPDLRKVLISSEGLPAVRLHTQGGDFFEQTFFLRRGDTNLKQGAAPAGFLQVLMSGPDAGPQWSHKPPEGSKLSYRRTAMAEWLTDFDQGAGSLLARVMANRLWQHHFGRGIVPTTSDFGARGEPPSHPELLEWLACELVGAQESGETASDGSERVGAKGAPTGSPAALNPPPSTPNQSAIRNPQSAIAPWSLKRLHKLIMSSAAYQLSSKPDDSRASVDPDNRLFWRQTQRRLEGEVIRDAMLAASGRLETRMYGPGTLDESQRRRSVYFTVKRSQMVPMMQVFDQPEPLSGVGDRPATTIAPQALMLMNNPQVRGHARALASRIAPKGADAGSLRQSLREACLAALARVPADDEMERALAFIVGQKTRYAQEGRPDAAELALADYCHVLLCLNEFVYVE